MGIRLVMEAATHAPASLTWRERYVLTVLAASAMDATRECPAGIEDRAEITDRMRLSRTQRYTVISALIGKGALLRLERGRNGARAVYAIETFTAGRPGDPDAQPVDNPQGTDSVPVENPAKSPVTRDPSGPLKGPGSENEGSPKPGLKHPGTRDPSAAGTSYRGIRGVKTGGGTPLTPLDDPHPARLYAVPAATREEEGIPHRDTPEPSGDLRAAAAEIRQARPDWSLRSILRALDQAIADGRPRQLAVEAMRSVAADPETRHPGRLRHDGDWWLRAVPLPRDQRPKWCGTCDERTRMREVPDPDRVILCPECHPRSLEAS